MNRLVINRLSLISRNLYKPLVINRSFSQALEEVKDQNSQNTSKQTINKNGTFKHRINTFLLGFGLASIVFYYALSSSVWKSTQQMDIAVNGLRSDVVQANAELQERVTILEQQVKKLQ